MFNITTLASLKINAALRINEAEDYQVRCSNFFLLNLFFKPLQNTQL